MENLQMPSIDEMNENKFFQGALFLLYVIGSKEVFDGASKNMERLLKIPLIKYLVVFSAAFVVTKNIKEAGILTLGYIVVVDYLLNPSSGISLIGAPKKDEELKDEFTRPVHSLMQPNEAPQAVPHAMEKAPEPEDKLSKFFKPMSLEIEPVGAWP